MSTTRSRAVGVVPVALLQRHLQRLDETNFPASERLCIGNVSSSQTSLAAHFAVEAHFVVYLDLGRATSSAPVALLRIGLSQRLNRNAQSEAHLCGSACCSERPFLCSPSRPVGTNAFPRCTDVDVQ